jgi:homoserine O-acetyltransferase
MADRARYGADARQVFHHHSAHAWQRISANPIYDGNFEKALSAITCKAIVMPGQTDLYFPPEDNEYEVSHMPNAECRPIPSIWGHIAGGPGVNPEDVRFIDSVLKEFLSS